ncbi:ComF family protein [Candidatus Shapirobacteria bacterium]|nr:ComF family protein [Candidatus Shapirobacteria bacterium]
MVVNLLHLLFPQECLLCGKTGKWLCFACRAKLSLAQNQICPVCLRSSLTGMTHFGCQKKNSLNGLYSPFAYRKEVKKLIGSFKFQMVKSLADTMADLLLVELKKNNNLISFWRKNKFILTPLPLHPIREKWRGFNQSLLIEEGLAKSFNLSNSSSFLKRVVFAFPQVGLDKKTRQKNIKNQFLASPAVKNKNIIIFDDVWTTGATLKEAGKELKRQGAKSVWGLTFCR